MTWLRAWRLPFRLARRDVRRRPGRSLLVALLVALPVTSLGLLDSSYRTWVRDSDARTLRRFGAADAVTSQTNGDCDQDCRTLLESELPVGTVSLWGIEGFIPVRLESQDESSQATVTTIDMNSPLLTGVLDLTEGHWPEASDEVALNTGSATAFGLAIGDQMQLAHQRSPFVLVGLIEGDSESIITLVAPGFDFEVVRPEFKRNIAYFALPDSFDGNSQLPIELRPDASSVSYNDSQNGLRLTLGWLGGVLAMSVLGVVVAAAFTISGRRQLAAIGQLSASGADQRTIVHALALQGTVTGVIGAGFGLSVTSIVRTQWPNLFGMNKLALVSVTDLLVIFATAVVIATIAAIVPARRLARVSVLTALAGRRPVGPDSRPNARRGGAMLVGGFVVAALAIKLDTGVTAVWLAALGILSALFGVCFLSPVIVEKFTGLAARGGGALRLAARSISRSGSSVVSTFAALCLVGIVTTGVGAFVEHNASNNFWMKTSARGDVFWVESTRVTFDSALGSPDTTPSSLAPVQQIRRQAEALLGQVEWTDVAAAFNPGQADSPYGPTRWVIASDDLLDLLDISAEHRALLAESPSGVQFVRDAGTLARDPTVPVVVDSHLAFGQVWNVISKNAAESAGLTLVPSALEFGVADRNLSPAVVEALRHLSRSNFEGLVYSDVEQSGEITSWIVARDPEPHSQAQAKRTRFVVMAGAMVLVSLLVLIGMSLMSVEGRGERDLLIAVGASPATIAHVAGVRAGGLTFAAMATAVPLGLVASWLVAWSSANSIAVPWLLAGSLLVLPFIAGCVASVSSAFAQRLRPLRSNSFVTD